MNRAFLVLAVLVCACLIDVPGLGAATTRPVDDPDLARAVRYYRNRLKTQPATARCRMSDLVELSIRGGLLQASIKDAARQRFEPNHIQIEGMGGEWQLSYTRDRDARTGKECEYVTLNRFDLDSAADGEIWHATLYVHSAGTVTLTGTIGGEKRVNVMLAFHDGEVSLGICRSRATGLPNSTYSAETLDRLRARCPGEFRQFVRPLLERLVGAAAVSVQAPDAYRAFAQIRPDVATVRRVEEVLPYLDAPLAEDRDRASQSLAKLGDRGVLAIMRMDRAQMTPEQASRLDEFLAGRDCRRYPEGEKARRDPAFLIECLEFDDPAVRAAAKEAIEKLLDKPIDFDPAADVESRAAAADGLWRSVAAVPATQPAVDWRGPAN